MAEQNYQNYTVFVGIGSEKHVAAILHAQNAHKYRTARCSETAVQRITPSTPPI